MNTDIRWTQKWGDRSPIRGNSRESNNGTIKFLVSGFLVVFNRNHGPKMHRLATVHPHYGHRHRYGSDL